MNGKLCYKFMCLVVSQFAGLPVGLLNRNRLTGQQANRLTAFISPRTAL
jgi:hypothetical protein